LSNVGVSCVYITCVQCVQSVHGSPGRTWQSKLVHIGQFCARELSLKDVKYVSKFETWPNYMGYISKKYQLNVSGYINL